MVLFFFFKQKTAYEMRISDWSSDVCSSDLAADRILRLTLGTIAAFPELERQIAAIGFGAQRHASGKEVAVAIIVARARIGKWRQLGTQLHARRRARALAVHENSALVGEKRDAQPDAVGERTTDGERKDKHLNSSQ